MVFQRRLSTEEIFALEALRDEADQLRAAEEALHAHAARLHYERGIAKAAIAEYAAVSRPTIYAWLDKHRPSWTTYQLLQSFDPGTEPFGLRLPIDWLEAAMTDDQIHEAITGYRIALGPGLMTERLNALKAKMSTNTNTSLRAVVKHYGLSGAQRLHHAWLRRGGIDNNTLKDILAWQP